MPQGVKGNKSQSKQKEKKMLEAFAVVVALVAAYVLLGRNQEARRIEAAVNERRNEDLLKAYQYGRPGHF